MRLPWFAVSKSDAVISSSRFAVEAYVITTTHPEKSTTAFLALSVPGSASAGYLKGRYGARRVLIAASVLVIASNPIPDFKKYV